MAEINFVHFHSATLGLEGGVSSLVGQGRNFEGGGWWNFWGWWNFGEQFQISPPNINGSLRTRCGGLSCHRSVQASAHMLCHVPLMGSYCQFCVILHPHRVAVPFPPTFVSTWRNSFVQIHGEQLWSRQKLGPFPKNEPKTTKIWGWGHLLEWTNPSGKLLFPWNFTRLLRLVLLWKKFLRIRILTPVAGLFLTQVAGSILGPLSQTHISKRVVMNEISSSALLDIQLTLFCVCELDSFLPELEHL